MNRNQVEGHANEAKGKAEKHGDKNGAALGEINDDPKEHDDKDEAESDGSSGDAEKHGDKDGAVLGEINDSDRKKSK